MLTPLELIARIAALVPSPRTHRHRYFGVLGRCPELSSRFESVVDVPVEKYLGPAEKINITVPRLVLARIDEFAKKKGQSRNGFLVEAARTAMHV